METLYHIPKVSVIIPLYNKAPYIKRALDSVLAQTIQDFEIIVVGGNSSDGGEDIVKKYTDSRIHFVQEAGKGVSAARNQGVDATTADLVAFLDADDEWLPEFLETILKLRNKWPDAGLYGTAYKVITRKGRYNNIFEEIQEDHLIQNWFAKKNNGSRVIIMTSGMAVPKNIYLEIGGFPVNSSQNEDRALRAKIALNYAVAYSPRVCMNYYLDYSTYVARARKAYLNESFSIFLNPNHQTIKNREDYVDICNFYDDSINTIIVLNLQGKQPRIKIREMIHKMCSKKHRVEKYYLLFLSYLPHHMMCLLLRVRPFILLICNKISSDHV